MFKAWWPAGFVVGIGAALVAARLLPAATAGHATTAAAPATQPDVTERGPSSWGEATGLRVLALRLPPGRDLKRELVAFAAAHHVRAGFILSAVGSLRKAEIRLADQPQATTYDGKFEIVSLTGTLSPDGAHLHLAISDPSGRTLGGHLTEGCTVYTTAEVVIGDAAGLGFSRAPDPQTGYKELVVRPASPPANAGASEPPRGTE